VGRDGLSLDHGRPYPQGRLDTIGDVRVEVFSTIADKDNHAAGGAWRSAQALNVITLHKRDGEIRRARVNIPPPAMR
jgi:hypothetical protein